MKHVVLDANICLNWFLPTSQAQSVAYSKAVAAFIQTESVSLHVPIHFDLEIAGPLLRSLRSQQGITEKAFNAAMQDMDALPLNFHELGMGFKKIADLARAYNLSIYDTPYFNLARAFDWPLATLDTGLLTAAKVRIPVNVTADSGNVTGNSGERDRWVGVARLNFMPSCFFG